ncbi:uncharacterized protein LOC124902135 [Homo sapiens]|uniref:uncharacterized protein LOC124902135 n=1 Tax=Homo sapiens TaxID=9606 RepID=UPI001FB14685|nr:uncharacterized protein LOC124902135 [Homo sapiens]
MNLSKNGRFPVQPGRVVKSGNNWQERRILEGELGLQLLFFKLKMSFNQEEEGKLLKSDPTAKGMLYTFATEISVLKCLRRSKHTVGPHGMEESALDLKWEYLAQALVV